MSDTPGIGGPGPDTPPDPKAVRARRIADAAASLIDGGPPDALADALTAEADTPDPVDAMRRAVDALNAGEPKAPEAVEWAARGVLDALAPALAVGLAPVASFEADRPDRVLWMDPERGGGTVLRAGDCALLSGAGGSGKSFASLALAVAAATGRGEAVGLNVRPGPAVLIGYEDDPATVRWRAGLIAAESGPNPIAPPGGLHLIPDPPPLMDANPEAPGRVRRCATWGALWAAVRAVGPSLVIVDPASAALAGVNQNDGGSVRRFVRALAQEAARGGWGCLIVAHSTKAARYGEDPGPGAVAGSGQWWDATRGVLFMRGDGPDRAAVECVKANHGPVGWAVTLTADRRNRPDGEPRFAGWLRDGRHSPTEWAARKAARAAEAKRGSDTSEKRPAKVNGRAAGPTADPLLDSIL